MRSFFAAIIILMVSASGASAQVDRHDVRAGNRKFRKSDFKEAEIDYRKALVRDSLSLAGRYNLASALYRQEDYESAAATIGKIAPESKTADVYFNEGDIAIKKQDWAGAVQAFRNSLLLNPDDMSAKENYTYAKMMLKDQQQQGGGQDQNQQNQDQQQNQKDQDQNQNQKDQDQQQNQQQNQDRQQNQQQPQGGEGKMSPQQAQQMLQAIQAREEETQDKVNKEKALMMKSRQKEKNW